MKCPHCNNPIDPAALMQQQRQKKNPPSKEHMTKMVTKRWEDYRKRKLQTK